MKKIISLIIITSLAVACHQSSTLDQKQAELEKLKKELGATKDKISALEDEIDKLDTTKKEDKSKLVAATIMMPQYFTHYIEIQGKVQGDEDVNISPESVGNVTEVLVREGDHVVKGQVLATLNDRITRQSMAEVQNQLELATDLYNKQKNLWDQKIGSEVQYLTAKSNKESLEKRLATMQQQLDMLRIKSPINGTVDMVNIKLGQSVAPGMACFRVVNLELLKVVGEVAESYIDKVHNGDSVKIYFPDFDKEIKSKVTYAGEDINNLNRTFNVEVRLNSTDRDFHPNMIAILKIADYSNKNAFVVPIGAVMKSIDGNYVFVASNENGRLISKRKSVTLGMVYNGEAEIKSGLEKGDKVVTTGYQNLVEGDEIKI